MPTEGMRPTVTADDMCIANPLAYSFGGELQRFDLVVFKPNDEQKRRFGDDSLKYLFRVVGLPKETIEIRDNQIFINDQLMDEPFEKIIDANDRKKNMPPLVISDGEYFFLGDNRPNSEDSRYWSKPTISRAQIISKIIEVKKDFYKQN